MNRNHRILNESTPRRTLILSALAVAFCVSMAYLPVLGAGWVYDDVNIVKPSPALKDFSGLVRAISADLYSQAAPRLEASPYWRPLALTSMWLDTRFANAPFILHAGNIFLHSLSTLLLVLALMRGRRDKGKAAIIAACMAAVWWGLHPQNVEAAAWISCRYDLLCAVALLCLLILRGRADSRRTILYGIVFLAGLLSKESFLFVVIVAVVMDFADRQPVRFTASRWIAVAGAITLWATARSIIGLKGLDTPTLPAILTILRVYPDTIGVYFGRVMPFVSLTISHPYAHGGMGVHTIVGIIVVIVLVSASIKFRRLGVASAIFLSGLIPAAGAMVMFHEAPERYFYVPSIGLALILGELLFAALPFIRSVGHMSKTSAAPVKRTLSAGVCAAVGITVAIGIVRLEGRLPDWYSDYTLWTAALRVDPRDPQANFNAGVAAGQCGNWDKALRAIALAAQGDPNSGRIANAYTWALLRTGDINSAVRQARHAVEVAPYQPDCWYYLAFSLHKSGNHAGEKAAVEKLLQVAPNYPGAREMFEIANRETCLQSLQ
jgi:hypothetical protein